jgi:hypothetical protein
MVEETPPVEEAAPVTERPATAQPGLVTTVRMVVAAALVGAAVIHFAYAPVHLEESTSHGLFFLGLGWAQVALVFALYRWRDARWPWSATALVNAGVILLWLVSRTDGLPGSDPEPWGFPDALASGLEAVAVLGAPLALRPAVANRPAPRVSPVLGGVMALALIGVVSASMTPSIAGEHDHGGGGDGHDHAAGAGEEHDHAAGASAPHDDAAAAGGHDHGGGEAAAPAVDRTDRCDLGFNTAAFNDVAVPGVPHAHADNVPVDFTLDQWAEVFVDPSDGVAPSVVADRIETQPLTRDSILTGSMTHTLDADPWNPLTSRADCDKLAGEVEQARGVVATYPTVADAEAGGWFRVTDYVPGIAAHYMKPSNLANGFVVDQPEMLLYDGTDPGSHIVGLSYYIFKPGEDEPTEGFTGNNDHYHKHVGLCIKDGAVVAGSNATEEQCAALGGRKANGTAGWMSHLWVVPGCESDWGLFSGANPALKVQLPGAPPEASGCGTGKTLGDPLSFDDPGGGPEL